MDAPSSPPPRVRFDRHELAGAFGDIGTDLPLLVAMIPAAGLDPASTFLLFGVAQVLTGLAYGLPMPMQPLKAMAVIVIAGQVPANVLFGGGLAAGAVMLLLAVSGGLGWLARVIPRSVVRGIQLGLALSLGQLALGQYVPADGAPGYALAAACFVIIVVLRGNRHLPPALPVIALGMIVALLSGVDTDAMAAGWGVHLPSPRVPTAADITTGFLVLALPQLPLSLSNSIIATDRTLRDLYPERTVGIRKLGITYGLANLALPFLGGVPLCHGCGGLAGHHAFGGRTGGSVILYGTLFIAVGFLFGGAAAEVVRIFPHPVLGVILLFEAVALGLLTRDLAGSRRDLTIALLVALCALALPQGYVVGLLVGTALHHAHRLLPNDNDAPPP
jgi:hypothetical protein